MILFHTFLMLSGTKLNNYKLSDMHVIGGPIPL